MTAAGTCERDVTSNSSASHHVRLCSRFGLRPEAHAQMGCMLSREYLLHARTGLWIERVFFEEREISATLSITCSGSSSCSCGVSDSRTQRHTKHHVQRQQQLI